MDLSKEDQQQRQIYKKILDYELDVVRGFDVINSWYKLNNTSLLSSHSQVCVCVCMRERERESALS